jgi:hypothetical protein
MLYLSGRQGPHLYRMTCLHTQIPDTAARGWVLYYTYYSLSYTLYGTVAPPGF